MINVARWLSCVLCIGALYGHASARALDKDSSDPRAILQAAIDQLGGESGISRVKMAIRQGSSTRERTLTVRSRRAPDVRKVLILIESPADVRNTGFLTVDYKAQTKSDEQWLYLPGLHRVSRVPSSGKSDSFVGSDFSISDLSGPEVDDYQLSLIAASVKLGDEECWQIEAIPRNEEVRAKTGYTKTQLWISKSKQILLQFKAWSVDAKKTKYFKASDIRQVDGYWTPHRLQMRTMQQGGESSETVIDVLTVKNRAPEVTDADFSEQRLARGV
jgi:hypothetical protein